MIRSAIGHVFGGERVGCRVVLLHHRESLEVWWATSCHGYAKPSGPSEFAEPLEPPESGELANRLAASGG